MRKISDEINEWCDNIYASSHIHLGDITRLRKMVDRIDYEMVELPKDKDGVPIHVCDTVWSTGSGGKHEVVSINLYSNDVEVNCKSPYDIYTFMLMPINLTHTKPDSLERIADELEDSNFLYGNGWSDATPQLSEWAQRIRKLAKEYEHATE